MQYITVQYNAVLFICWEQLPFSANPAALWLGKSPLLQLHWALTGHDVCWRPAVVTAQACSTLPFMVWLHFALHAAGVQ